MNYDVSYDTGDKSIQCGRVNDTFKLWLTWKAKVLHKYGHSVTVCLLIMVYRTVRSRAVHLSPPVIRSCLSLCCRVP